MPERRRSALLIVAVAFGLLAGCTSTPEPSPSATASVTEAEPSVTPTPSPSVPLGKVAVDRSAKLAVSPVPYGELGVVEASFGDVVEGRTVSLQRMDGEGWAEVASGVLDAKGRVQFQPPVEAVSYRAVALDYDLDGLMLPAVSSPVASAEDQWKLVQAEEFDGSSLRKPWTLRLAGKYYHSRWCSGVAASQVTVADGSLRLGVAKADADQATRVRANAAKATGKSTDTVCPYGVYDNAMVSTENRFSFTYGTVAVRLKFPYQRGMHAAAWLQTHDGRDIEIDFIESFGFQSKWGVQNMLHPKSQSGTRLDVGHYPDNVPGRKTREWWDQYHTASVEWTRTGYVFRLDGVETFRTSKALSDASHFLVLSLLSADYETDRLKPAQLPASLEVDWIRVWQQR